MEKKRKMPKWLKAVLVVLCAVVVIALCYFAYVFIAYHRIGNEVLTVSGKPAGEAQTEREYKIVSYNIGFGAFESDYGFFMDGGTESWAWSPERLAVNLGNISDFLAKQNADFYIVQEVDRDSTRSYHTDELEPLMVAIGVGNACTWAQNYDSPFLFYPFTQPHGKSVSGLLTVSSFPITKADRVELPIEDTLMKLLDLDRCYSVNRIPVAGGKELVLYNFHLSAYTSDGTIATEQLKLLLADMQSEYDKGNYCIAGGDFNKDLLGDSEAIFGTADKEYSWAQPIPEGTFDSFNVTLVAPLDKDDPVPSCRNADGPYHEGQYVLTVDGFLVSDNVEVNADKVIDLGFAYSDHNPVEMTFTLK